MADIFKQRSQIDGLEDEKTSTLSPDQTSDEQELNAYDGLEFPTDEEKAVLRRVSDTIPWNAFCASTYTQCPQLHS